MRAQSQGLMATLMMFVPLLAVPFVANLGVPWLANRAATTVGNLLEKPKPTVSQPVGVGHSETNRMSVDDLFAPMADVRGIDLNPRDLPKTPAERDPRLKNASLVVSTEDDSWNDPFHDFPGHAGADSAPAPQNFDSAHQTVEVEDDVWGPIESPDEDVAEAAPPETPNSDSNPFARLETEPPSPSAPVASENIDAFPPEPEGTPSPGRFDASRTLFAGANSNEPRSAGEVTEFSPPVPEPPARQPFGPPAATETPAASAPVRDSSSNAPRSIVRTQSPDTLTWEFAREQLQKFGIKRYYLQPDPTGETFLFRCSYAAPNNPRIHRIFEAEAKAPLEAVAKVLDQLKAASR